MENTQNNMPDNKKTVLVIVMVGIVVLGGLILWMKQAKIPQQVGVSPTPTSDAEAAAINQDIDSINVGDLNSEFNAIDKNLQGL